ncbi:MTH865 family protein [Haloarcula sp. S1AR25-5A]|uniref:MTH865 family protein n=1 Tax=Haloarcula terrestris TaxID=2950533 RepID=A0AAE4F054_9EURY|nr:MTH865 family protein [Haloarcula terrestris]MDS0223525.1 MTH865 family protein [Haloarcula terrestris]
MSEATASKLRKELEKVFNEADYPISEPMELIPVLPDGAGTTFEADNVRVGVMDFGSEYADYQDYPYESADALIDDLMTGFHEEGLFD